MNLLDLGPRAWLVEFDADGDGDGDPAAFAAAVRAAGHDDIVEVIPAARTVAVTVRDASSLPSVARWLTAIDVGMTVAAGSGRGAVEIPVVYDGEDLGAVAAATGMSVAEVVDRHAGASYRCGFCGFAPGFAYLRGLDEALHLARRSTPRTRVPAGSVAIAAEFSAVYPAASPGGWHLIGRTDVAMWCTDRRPPALVGPGVEVRFVRALR